MKLRKHTLTLPVSVSGVVYDVGPGIRPYRAGAVCVEPNAVYADILRHNGYTVIQETARDALPNLRPDATVLLLDVIEHMEKDEGREVVIMLERFDHAVIFTPLGFMAQESDEWGLEQHEHQRHKSGWFPEEFPNWRNHVMKGFHKGHGAFFCYR